MSSSGPPPTGRRPGAAWWVGAGIFLSRIAGLVRDATVAYWLGSRGLADVVAAGLRIPNVLQNLLGEGTLSASFIPVYARMLDEGREEEAGRFAGAILGILTVIAFGVALVGVLASPLIADLLLSQRDEASRTLLATILRILFPMTATLVVSAWALGVLNSHRRFFLSYVAPVLWNVAIVTALVMAGSAVAAGEGTPEDIVVAFAWGALAGAGLQLAVQLPVVFGLLRGFRLSVSRRVTGVTEAVRAFGPVVAARGVVNISAWVDVVLAGLLIEGAVINLQRAQTFYLLPISLFAMAVAASELPELSRIGAGAAHTVADPVRAALRRVRFFLIPSAVAYLVFGDLLVGGLYQRGAFGADDSAVVGWILGAYALGLVASGSSRTLSSAFYAVRDTKTPAVIASLRVVVALGIGAALMTPLDDVRVGTFGLGAMGLALGSAVAAWLEYGLLRRALAKRIGEHAPGWGGAVRLAVAAGAGAGVAVGTRIGLAGAGVDLLIAAIGTAAAFGVVYLAVAALLGEGMPLRRRRP